MTQIFLAPRSNETSYKNFESTILGGRRYEFLEPYLNDKEKEVLSKYEEISVWGNKASLRSRWEKMKPGDYVLFYARGSFYYSARVVLTKESHELGEKLWPTDENGEPWTCLFFVDNLREINIPIETIQRLAEYEPSWDRVQGFMRLNDHGLQAIESKFGSIEKFLSQDQAVYDIVDNLLESTDEETIEDEKEQVAKEAILAEAQNYKDSGESYVIDESPRRQRKENRVQKKRVAIIEEYSCQVCGWSLEWTNSKNKKVYRIDVDHIVDKSKGGGEKLSNLWALCPNCHAKKTAGVITIDVKAKKVFENGEEISLHHDNHLGWEHI